MKIFKLFELTVAQCEAPVEPNPPLSLRLEGLKLGQRAIYRCPMGYILQGTPNATCLASGECRNKIALIFFSAMSCYFSLAFLFIVCRKFLIPCSDMHSNSVSTIVFRRSTFEFD